MVTHRMKIHEMEDIDEELLLWIHRAYDRRRIVITHTKRHPESVQPSIVPSRCLIRSVHQRSLGCREIQP
jgi:hypothetical protein